MRVKELSRHTHSIPLRLIYNHSKIPLITDHNLSAFSRINLIRILMAPLLSFVIVGDMPTLKVSALAIVGDMSIVQVSRLQVSSNFLCNRTLPIMMLQFYLQASYNSMCCCIIRIMISQFSILFTRVLELHVL